MLQVTDLTISFGNKKALEKVSFSIGNKEVVAVVGESGSGKSLCSLAVMKLLPNAAKVVEGEIRFGDLDLLAINEGVRGQKIAMIFQEPMTSLNPVFTCGEQITETILNNEKVTKKAAIDRSIGLLKQVKLADPEKLYNKYPHELSGGQKQRVMIAVAISCNPQLLIADEPTTALDVTVQKEVLELLKEIQEEKGMSMLFITHDLPLVANIASRVIVMKKGKIVEQGPVKEVFESPTDIYTKALLACKPPLDKRFVVLPTIEHFVDSTLGQIEEISKEARREAHNKIYSETPFLEVENLKVSYATEKNWFGKTTRKHVAVDDVSFQLFKGESLGLIGESGCGKTSIGRALVQLISQEEGVIKYKDKKVSDYNREEMLSYRKDVQIIFQDPFASLNPRKTIGSSILEPLTVHREGSESEFREEVLELLEKVGLERENYFKYPHEFSGGQRQRISIARTLVMQPKIIICDESVSALDVSIQAQVLNLLNDLKREFGLTYIFISHDLSVVKYFCDRMLVMNKKGKIEEEGECDLLYDHPKSDYTRALIQAIPK